MILECLESSSAGNCYIFHASDGQKLIVECGVRYSDILKAIGWNPSKVAGCIITHEHRDHCESFPKMVKAGIKCYALPEVFESFGYTSNFMSERITPPNIFNVGKFMVKPFPVRHDVPCLGFIIAHKEMGSTMFLTDTMYTEFRPKGLNHIMIEANYSDEILQYNIDNREEPASMRDRLLASHMEIANTIKILNSTNLDFVNEVVLLHLSARNGNPTAFQARVKESITLPVYTASKRLKLNFNKTPY